VTDVASEAAEWVDATWRADLTAGQWWQALTEAGYCLPQLPASAFGRGYDGARTQAVRRALAERGCLGPPGGVGTMLAAPTIAACGTSEQIERLVPPILTGRHAWCQLFSEPGAGSDLAGLQCVARRDGSDWVITGQKVWTSGAATADMGMLLARTDPSAPKHRGISYFAFPMRQDGVTVRPLREMSGRALFNEVFIEEARVSDDDLLGKPGDGWRIANVTLGVERDTLGNQGVALPAVPPGELGGNLDRPVNEVLATAQLGEEGVPPVGPEVFETYRELVVSVGARHDPDVRDALMRLYTLVEINRLTALRAQSGADVPGVANLAKLTLAQLYREFRDVGNLIIGADGLLAPEASAHGGTVQEITLFSPGPAIFGGTDQIQRNILAERVLGLPREPGPDSATPFNQLLKN
jgi:alkylation response protein AidB-like acyl-CoA dehydrogenase